MGKSIKNSKKIIAPLSLLLLFSLLFSFPACAAPRRIVSLCPVGTEILYLLGQEDNIVGVTEFCDYPPEAAQKPKLGGFSTVSFEKIVESGAELAVLSDLHAKYTEDIKKLGVACVMVKQESIADIYSSIAEIGDACGAREAAQSLIADMKSELAQISASVAAFSVRDVLLCISRDFSEPRLSLFYAAGGGTFYDELITLAGGRNVLGDAVAYPRVSAEGLISLDPEIIIDLVGDSDYYHASVNFDKEAAFRDESLLSQWKGVPHLRAAREDKIFLMRGTLFLRPGPRIPEIARAFAAAIHPEAKR